MDHMLPALFNSSHSSIPTGEDINELDINFDRTLPGLHKYLGNDFVEVTGRTYLEPHTETHMYAFYRSGVILVPGQTLPLIPYGRLESELLLKVYRERRPLIFLPGCFDNFSDLKDLVNGVGTTADLVAIRIPDEDDDDDDDEEESTIHAIFVGRQRIRISKLIRDATFPLVCHGQILPEISASRDMSGHPVGWGLIPRSWARFGNDPRPTREKANQSELLAQVGTQPQSRRIRRSRSSRHSRDSSSSSASTSSIISSSSPQSLISLPVGNPLSIFNSRLSTWRNFGPVTSGRSHGVGHVSPDTLSTFGTNSTRTLDHFVDDSAQPTVAVEPSHYSAPDLLPTGISTVLPPPTIVQHSRSLNGQSRLTEEEEDEVLPSSGMRGLSCLGSAATELAAELPPPVAVQSDDIPTEEVDVIVDRAVDRNGMPFRYRIRQPSRPLLLARRDVLAAAAHTFTGLPFWLCRQYDVNYLVSAIQVELFTWNDTWQVEKFRPELSIPFSYWLVQNLPIPSPLKAKLLGINHVVQRLRALLDIIRRSSACVCALCHVHTTSNRFIVCLASEGSFQTYVNPSGILHDIVTVSQVTPNSVMLIGSASEDYSWFPGYSWTITNCSSCSQHLGWLFTAIREELRPIRFWGIRRDAIVPGLIDSPDWHPCL